MPFVHDLAFDRPAYRPHIAQGPARATSSRSWFAARHRRRRHRAGRLSAVADLGSRSPQTVRQRLPVSVGGTLFNVPAAAIRRKIQRHSGPQERVDLSFMFPSLEPPEAPKHVSADTVEEKVQPIDRIFVSISAHRDSLAPDMRVRTIYPRYLEQASTPVDDGLTMRAFRDGSPYGNEDLFSASAPGLNARCTRDAATPGMCLSETPHRRRRPDVPLSAELARAMARCRRCDGAADGADARAERLSRRLGKLGKFAACAACPSTIRTWIRCIGGHGLRLAHPTARARAALTRPQPDLPRGSPSGTGTSGRRPRHRRTARR